MKKFFMATLSLMIMIALTSQNVFATTTSLQVSVGYQVLTENNDEVQWDSDSNTLTLNNASLKDSIEISSNSEVTIIVKGNTSIETDGAYESALYSIDVPKLNVVIEEGATFSLKSEEGNGIFLYEGELNVSGLGNLVVESNGLDALYIEKDITLQGITANIISQWNAIYTNSGNVTIKEADLTIEAGLCGIFTRTFDEVTETAVNSSVQLLDSSVKITTADDYDDPRRVEI